MLKGNSNGGAGLSASVCGLPHSLVLHWLPSYLCGSCWVRLQLGALGSQSFRSSKETLGPVPLGKAVGCYPRAELGTHPPASSHLGFSWFWMGLAIHTSMAKRGLRILSLAPR